MKYYILNIILFALALGFAGCSDDALLTEPVEDEQMEYTLTLALPDDDASRGVSSEAIPGLKTYWCYGDRVILSNGVDEYIFRIYIPSGKHEGDRVPSRTATFTCSGITISGYKKFSGTLKYSSGASTNRIYNGFTRSNAKAGAGFVMPLRSYELQTANDNTSHLASLDNLSVELKNVDLSKSNVFHLQRDFSIIKIVIDGFKYPVFDGSLLFVDGVDPDHMRCLGLGENTLLTSQDITYYSATEIVDPTDDGHTPFCDVSETKDPFTLYAERDGDHKITAYLAVLKECEIPDGQVITVMLRDQWSFDWYVWQTLPLRGGIKLPLGSIYTLDFTRKFGDKFEYEPIVGINTVNDSGATLLIKNLGAENIADVGDYFMFGYNKPIHKDGFYPGHPDLTPYYFYGYNEELDKDYLACNYLVTTGEDHVVTHPNYFGNPASYGARGNVYIGSTTAHTININDHYRHPADWWRDWASGLQALPDMLCFKWRPCNNITDARTDDWYLTIKPINATGQVDYTHPIGLRCTAKRTGHTVFMPFSGILVPSEENNLKQIMYNATANVMEGSERYASFLGYCLYLPPIDTSKENNGKDALLVAYTCEFTPEGCKSHKIYHTLNAAVPVRPVISENMTELRDYIYACLDFDMNNPD